MAKGKNGKWELYNIAKDRSEQRDLADEQPELAIKLANMWQAYAERADVLPLNPNASSKVKYNKKQKRFRLGAGAELDRTEAPFVERRPLHVTADVNIEGDGVIVAQGGVTHGWALYVQDGQLKFATTHDGKRTVLSSNEKISGPSTISAGLARAGNVNVIVGDQQLISGDVPGMLKQQPLDGLQVGQDTGGNVGSYESPFPLSGSVNKLIIEIGR